MHVFARERRSFAGGGGVWVVVDSARIVANPTELAQAAHNTEEVFALLRACGIDLLWTAEDWVSFPDDDFVVLQLHRVFSHFRDRKCALQDASTSDDVSGADGLQKTVAKLSGMLDDAAKHVAAVCDGRAPADAEIGRHLVRPIYKRFSPVVRFQHLIAWVGPFQLTDARFAYGTALIRVPQSARARRAGVPARDARDERRAVPRHRVQRAGVTRGRGRRGVAGARRGVVRRDGARGDETARARLRVRVYQARSIQKFFTHRPVSTFDRIPFQLTDELFLYGMALSGRTAIRTRRADTRG